MIYYINKDKSDVEEPQKNKFNGPMLENINDGVLKIRVIYYCVLSLTGLLRRHF